jgi:gamma-glutamyltranspeptidase
MPRRTLLGLLATIAVIAAPTAAAAGGPPYQHTPQPVAQGTGGSAATADSVATTAATDALRAGGNAVDAAVAAAAVLGVTEPFSSGIGGGGFMIIRTPDGKVTTIDSREKSPAAMQPDSFFVDGVPPDPSDPAQFAFARYSGLSAGVPGTVAGWDHALREYGTWSLDRALQRGIDVARKGFVIDKTFYEQAQTMPTTSTTSGRPRSSTWTPTAPRTTSAPSSATPALRAPTSASRGSASRASTAARSRARSRARCRSHRSRATPTTSGARA